MASSKWTAAAIGDLHGQLALVTGANSGIGLQASRELARHGAEVLLGCRDAAKGEAAVQRLRAELPGAAVSVLELDMASLASVRAAADRLLAENRPLDLLINNAGVMALPGRELTADGFERQFGTNHLGHFALTGRLIPALLRGSAPRVVTVSSLAHRNGKMNFGDLQSEQKYDGWTAYNQSKLANLLFALELDRRARAAGSRLRSLPVHPGISKTSIFDNGPRKADLKSRVAQLLGPVLMQSDEMGALPTLYAATAPEAEGGDYIGPDGWSAMKGWPTVEKPRPQALDEAVARRLWEQSEQLTGVVYPPLA